MSKWTDEQAREAFDSAFPSTVANHTLTHEVGRRILDLEAELAAMRPVVEAAEAERDAENAHVDATYLEGAGHKVTLLKWHAARAARMNAVDARRAQQEGK